MVRMVTLKKKLQRQKVEWWLPGAGARQGMGSYCFMGIKFQFYKMKRVMEMDGDDVCTRL